MIDKIFLDTNIIVYAFDKKDVQKNKIVKVYLSHFIQMKIILLVRRFCLNFAMLHTKN